jgi:hypothetical protein
MDNMEREKTLPPPGIEPLPISHRVCCPLLVETHHPTRPQPVCDVSLLFQKQEYETYRASLIQMAVEVRKTIIKLRTLQK